MTRMMFHNRDTVTISHVHSSSMYLLSLSLFTEKESKSTRRRKEECREAMVPLFLAGGMIAIHGHEKGRKGQSVKGGGMHRKLLSATCSLVACVAVEKLFLLLCCRCSLCESCGSRAGGREVTVASAFCENRTSVIQLSLNCLGSRHLHTYTHGVDTCHLLFWVQTRKLTPRVGRIRNE